jgi:hypothetical protein
MKTVVVNARFAGIKATGVQSSAHEIVSRLILDNPDHYALVSQGLTLGTYPHHYRSSTVDISVTHISESKPNFRKSSGGRVETPPS